MSWAAYCLVAQSNTIWEHCIFDTFAFQSSKIHMHVLHMLWQPSHRGPWPGVLENKHWKYIIGVLLNLNAVLIVVITVNIIIIFLTYIFFFMLFNWLIRLQLCLFLLQSCHLKPKFSILQMWLQSLVLPEFIKRLPQNNCLTSWQGLMPLPDDLPYSAWCYSP